jgi:mannose-6-phosphate isomerase-like protein (cupin superfamily)
MSEVSLLGPGTGEIIRIGPVQMRVLEDGSHTDQRLGVAEVTVPPSSPGPPQHIYRMLDETFLIMSGAARFTVGETN